MRRILASIGIAFSLFAAAPCAAQSVNLSGEWLKTYSDGSAEKIRIQQSGKQITATKITGNARVPAGKVTFKGAVTANPSMLQCQVASEGFVDPHWAPCTLTVLDSNNFRLTDGASYQRVGSPQGAITEEMLKGIMRDDPSSHTPAETEEEEYERNARAACSTGNDAYCN